MDKWQPRDMRKCASQHRCNRNARILSFEVYILQNVLFLVLSFSFRRNEAILNDSRLIKTQTNLVSLENHRNDGNYSFRFFPDYVGAMLFGSSVNVTPSIWMYGKNVNHIFEAIIYKTCTVYLFKINFYTIKV